MLPVRLDKNVFWLAGSRDTDRVVPTGKSDPVSVCVENPTLNFWVEHNYLACNSPFCGSRDRNLVSGSNVVKR